MTRIILAILIGALLLFWLLPATHSLVGVMWIGVMLVTGCVLYLSFACRRLLSTWHGLGIVTTMLFLVLVWLRWQWSLWWSDVPLLQNVNTAISLLAWALFIALYASSFFLLIYRDASVVFMAASWVIYLLIVLAIGAQYGRLENLTTALLGEQLFWGVPLLWAVGIGCLSPPAFLGHLVILLIKELKARNAQ